MNNSYITLDVETGIEPNNVSGPGGDANPYAGVPLVMVGWKEEGALSDTSYWDGPGTRPFWVGLFDAMRRDPEPTMLVGHNISFDLHHLFYDWRPEQVMEMEAEWTIWDTQTVEYYLTGQKAQSCKLVDLENKYLNGEGREIAKDEVGDLFKAGIGSDKIDREMLETYLRDDLQQTERVFLAQRAEAERLGMLEFIAEMMEAQLLSFIMEKEGMTINLDIIPDIIADAESELDEAQESIRHLLPKIFDGDVSKMNGLTNNQLARTLVGEPFDVKYQAENGVYKGGQKKGQVKMSWFTETITVKTPPPVDVRQIQGVDKPALPSTAEKSLDQLSKHMPDGSTWAALFTTLLATRRAEKKCNTYAKGYLLKTGPDGQLRTNINQSIAATGRVSSSNPNLQNLPGDM